MIVRGVILSLVLLLPACATYTQQPLEPSPAALEQPVAGALEAKANAIERPWLQPVTIDLSRPLTPEAIATLAVVNNPDLEAQRVRAGVSEAQVFAAGLLPDPTISLGAGKVLSGPDPFLDLAGGLGLDLNAIRARGVTRAQALADARQVRLDLAWSEWQIAGKARLEAARIQGLEQAVELARISTEAARTLFERTSRAAGRGDISGDRLQTASLAAVDAADTLRTAESGLVAAREELARLLGFVPGTPVDLAPLPLPLPAEPPPAEVLFAIARENRADLAALQAGHLSQEAAVHKAVLDQFPTLNLAINANRDSAGNFLLGPSVDFTLPLWNRNRGGIAVERATRAALKAEYEARLFETRADIGAAVAGIRVAIRQYADALRGLDELRHFAEASQRAAGRGDLSLETAQNAAQALRDRQSLIARSESDIIEQMIALELLTGTPREAWPR